ncbi:hypothetical protein CEXT_290811 [Caerostris extrusa]|uniref:Uncharacterized protein n=1 Tax=Caerostris extrusa TaxID=172846 RepID=A0AAV4VB07_CAEEX|nr:hypothetical protein CEXT_290811 [Caerostris extrusa]
MLQEFTRDLRQFESVSFRTMGASFEPIYAFGIQLVKVGLACQWMARGRRSCLIALRHKRANNQWFKHRPLFLKLSQWNSPEISGNLRPFHSHNGASFEPICIRNSVGESQSAVPPALYGLGGEHLQEENAGDVDEEDEIQLQNKRNA